MPLAPVLGLDRRFLGWQEHRGVVIVIMAEQITSPGILHVEPPWWEGNDRNHKFPVVLPASKRKFLDVNPRARRWIVAIDIEHFVIQDIDDVVGNLADTVVSYLTKA